MIQPLALASTAQAMALSEAPQSDRDQAVMGRGALGGTFWSAASAAANIVLPVATFVVFARTLGVAEVSLVALAVAVSEVIKSFGLPGLYEALLQERADFERCAGTASAALILVSLLLYGVYLLLIPLLARTAPEVPGAWLVLALVGLRIPFDLMAIQPLATHAAQLSYRRMAMRTVIAMLGAGGIGLTLAFGGLPFAGLVAYQTSLPALTLLATGAGALAQPRFHREVLVRLMPEALRASGVRLNASANIYLDQVVVAGVAGGNFLAYYNLGKRIEAMFATAAGSFNSILLQPLFARGEGHGQVLQRGLALMTATCGVGATVTAVNYGSLVGLVFGPTWAEAGPAVAVLALGAYVRALGSVHGALLSVSRRNRELLWVSGSSAALGICLVVLTAPLGLVPCAIALLGRNCAATLWMAWLTRRDLPSMARTYALVVLLPIGAALAGALYVPGLFPSGLGFGGWMSGMFDLAVSGLAALVLAGSCLGLSLLLRPRHVAQRFASPAVPCSERAWR